MPLVYRIRCSNCSQVPDAAGHVAGYVSHDGHSGGMVLPDGYLALKLDDGKLVCLPHPVEESVLHEHGFTWKNARAQRRLFFVVYKVCEGCGALHEEVQVSTSETGCIVCPLAFTIALFLLRFVVAWSWGISLVASFAILMLLLFAFSWRDKIRWLRKNEDQILRRCPSCGHDRLLTFSKARGKTLPCPFCKASAVTCTCAGIS